MIEEITKTSMLADDSSLLNTSDREHFLLLYSNESKRDEKIIKFINEGLKRNQLCIHASVDRDEQTKSRLSLGITDYETNIKKGNLIVADISHLYKAALRTDLRPFDDFATAMSLETQCRQDRYIRMVDDCVPTMFQNQHMEEALKLEEWLHKKPFNGSTVCALPNSILDEDPFKNLEKSFLRYHDKIIIC